MNNANLRINEAVGFDQIWNVANEVIKSLDFHRNSIFWDLLLAHIFRELERTCHEVAPQLNIQSLGK